MSTLRDIIQANHSLYVNCSHPECFHSVKLDVPALADRLGPDHGGMHADLVRYFKCMRCEAEGRPRRAVFFTYVQDYDAMQRLASQNWKPTFPPA